MNIFIGTEVNDESTELLAFKLMCELLTPKNIKDSADHIYIEYQVNMYVHHSGYLTILNKSLAYYFCK